MGITCRCAESRQRPARVGYLGNGVVEQLAVGRAHVESLIAEIHRSHLQDDQRTAEGWHGAHAYLDLAGFVHDWSVQQWDQLERSNGHFSTTATEVRQIYE